jgi:hypothetical protein
MTVQAVGLTPVPIVPVDPRLDGLDAPVRRLFERVAGALRGTTPELTVIAGAMIDLAGDHDYLAHHLARMGDMSGSVGIHRPARGPRLMLVHRPEGAMGAVHDHGCWVALAPVTGIETHRRFRRLVDGRALERLELVTDEAVGPGRAVTMLAPDDVHAHGHVAGRGDAAYVLVMTGDDQRLYRRTEWDTATGRARVLQPGDGGRWLDSEPFPG